MCWEDDIATETLASVPEMLQADVAALQTDMAVIKGQLPHLATKAGVAELRADMERLRADMEQLRADFEHRLPHLATKADMERGFRQMTWALVSALLVGLTALAGLIVALQIFG